jgi:hypothetical protein
MASMPPIGKPVKTRFRGVRLPPEYERVIDENVEQASRDPEDRGQSEVRNSLKKYGTPSVD